MKPYFQLHQPHDDIPLIVEESHMLEIHLPFFGSAPQHYSWQILHMDNPQRPMPLLQFQDQLCASDLHDIRKKDQRTSILIQNNYQFPFSE